MMTCRQIENELSAYVDGELADAVRSEVQAHLGACERCRQRLAQLERLSDGVARLPRLEPPPRFVSDLFRRLRARPEPRQSWVDWVFRPVWLKLPVEAVAVLVVAVGVMFLAQHGQKREQCGRCATITDPKAAAPTAPAEVEARKGEAMTAPTAAAPEPATVLSPAPTKERAGAARRLAAAAPSGRPESLAFKMEAADKSRALDRLSVVNTNPAVAEQRVRTLVKTVRGSVVEVRQDGGAPRNMRVRLPATEVVKFKAQLVETNADAGPKSGGLMDAVAESAKSKEEPMTELEIRIVVPPAR